MAVNIECRKCGALVLETEPRIDGMCVECAHPDVRVEKHGSVVLVRPLTKAAREWITYNVSDEPGDGAQWFAGSLAVEPRYVENLVAGMMGDGLVVA